MTMSSERQTFTARVAAYLTARAGEWVDATELMAVGGRCAWRTRVSEARDAYGLTIENRVRTVKDGARRWRVSEYRVPAQGQGRLF